MIAAERVGQSRRQRPLRLLTGAQDAGYGLRDKPRIGKRRQLYEPDAIPERGQVTCGNRMAETRLADPTGTGQRQQAGRAEEATCLGDLRLAADEARKGVRQIV